MDYLLPNGSIGQRHYVGGEFPMSYCDYSESRALMLSVMDLLEDVLASHE
ncbi:MAG: hypothetical protein WKF84_16935 [Pyrinomonadaceae bacterium]